MISRNIIFLALFFSFPLLSYGLNCFEAENKLTGTSTYDLKKFKRVYHDKIAQFHKDYLNDIQTIKIKYPSEAEAKEFILEEIKNAIDTEFREQVIASSFELQLKMEKLIGFSSPVKENGRTTFFTIVLSPEVHIEFESFFLNYVKKMKALFNKNPYVFHKSLRAAKYYINVSRALKLLHMVLKPENCQSVYSYDCVFKIPHEEFIDLSLQYERREIPVPGESCFNYEPSRVEKVTETTNLNHWKNGEWTSFKDIFKESEYLIKMSTI